ncbi:MAG: chemotaxis protein [SAR324 cluster bacterium]|uniref:protein-glutamate O-methyltransferase n=1 Tax=SAR324 cluster bacterium TaxID=2024889 RepID=A0A2A4T468_9DELT|nr:MAG: chemotaxis protein [SAR324 cluster bacterium]
MIEPLQQYEFEKLRDLLASVCGIVLKADQDYLVETRLTELANEIGVANFGELHRAIIMDESLLSQVVDLMTTNETLWFRDDSCWATLEHSILPSLIERLHQGQRNIRIWSAACSTGQEPYSLVILIREILEKQGRPDLLNRFELVGTDISNAALYLAQKGCYDPFTISRGMPDSRLAKHFSSQKKVWTISPEIRAKVKFQAFNLMDSFAVLGEFDLVLCRNVAIYFSEQFKKDLFRKITGILRPESFMLLGATESLLGIETDFKNMSYGNGLYYQIGKTKNNQ